MLGLVARLPPVRPQPPREAETRDRPERRPAADILPRRQNVVACEVRLFLAVRVCTRPTATEVLKPIYVMHLKLSSHGFRPTLETMDSTAEIIYLVSPVSGATDQSIGV